MRGIGLELPRGGPNQDREYAFPQNSHSNLNIDAWGKQQHCEPELHFLIALHLPI